MNQDRDQLVASPEELRSAMERLRVAHSGKLDPVRVDEQGRLVFFPFWPLGRQGYAVPDERTAAALREQVRRMQWWSKLVVWVPIPLSFLVYRLGLRPGWFFAALGGDLVLVIAASLTWQRRVVQGLKRAPRSDLFSYRRRLESQAVASRLPRALLGIGVAGSMVAASLFFMRFPPGGTEQTAGNSDLGGLPFWADTLLLRMVCLAAGAVFGLVLAAFTYQAWYLVTHRAEVRLRRRATRLWG